MKKCITVYLLRHGETQWNVKKMTQGHARSQLNQTGKKQAKKAALFFKDMCLHTVYCSPLVRTVQTAKEVMKYHHPSKLVKCPEFAERYFGKLEGWTRKQLFKRIPDIEKQWKRDGLNWRPPGNGETIREQFIRVYAGFLKVVKKHKLGDTILIISHGGPIKCLLQKFHKGSLSKNIFNIRNPHNCEIIQVLWNKKPLRVRCLRK